MKVKQEDGTEIEVLTQEEAEALAAAKVAEVEAAKQAEIEALAAEKAEAEERAKKLEDKDYNFAQVRKKAEGKELELSEEIKKQIADINQKVDSIAAQPKNEVKEDFIKTVIGEDKEKRERFDYYFKKLGSEAKTKEEVLKASNEAWALATNGEYKPNMDYRMFSTTADQNYRQQVMGEQSEASKEIASMLGVTEEDRKKYGKKGV